ncbi:hypothetical protein V2J09_018359, partial [Rumex salicifolius]
VGQFKYIFGAKATLEIIKKTILVVTHDRTLKHPTEFDARTTWPQCATIGRILGRCSHLGYEPGYPKPKCHRQCKDGNQVWKKSEHLVSVLTELALTHMTLWLSFTRMAQLMSLTLCMR